MKTFDQELVSGSVGRSIWKLAWPAVALSLVNGLHGFVDHVLVGHYLGYKGNAAIGVAWQLFLVVMVFIVSLFGGMGVVVARATGRQDRETVNRAVYHTFLFVAYFFVFVALPGGYFLAPHLLPLVHADAEVQANALPYLRILFMASAPLFLMIMVTTALQSAGNPKTPLALGILATLLNMVITAVLISVFNMGTAAAAIGTCAAPLVSIAIAIVLMARGKLIVRFPEKLTLIPDFSLLKVTARIGIPTGLQNVLLNIGGVVLLRYVGSLEQSAAAQAAYTICYSQLFSFVVWASIGLRSASAAMIGQNIGAGRPERGRRGVQLAAVFGVTWAIALGILFWTVPQVLLGFFDAAHEPVLSLGVQLLRFLAFSGMFLASAQAFTGGLQGAGETKTPMYIAFLSQIIIMPGLCATLHAMGILTPAGIWASILIGHATRFFLTYIAFRSGRWANIRLEIER
jgi:putative MATE family efflux protein